MAVMSEDMGFQVCTDLTTVSALGLLNMAMDGLIAQMMQDEHIEE